MISTKWRRLKLRIDAGAARAEDCGMEMIQREAKPPPADFDVTHPLRPVILAGLVSLVQFALSAVISYRMFAPHTPPALILHPALFAAGFMTLWTAACLVVLIRRPAAREGVLVWGRVTRVIIYATHICCVWLIWGIAPYGTPADQFVAMLFMTTTAPTQILASPENTTANRIGIVAVLGSSSLFLATRGTSLAMMLAVYMAVYAVLMLVLSGVVRRTVNQTVAARLNADAAALRLERLLEQVAEERDAKTRFIMAASHDLGQPLQAAALFFDQTIRAPTADARDKAAGGVRRAFASAEQLLAHMLNHLRLEADAVDPQLSRVALFPLLSRIAAQHAPAAQEAGMTIRVPAAGFTLLADPVLMERAIGNLVHNAIHHSHGTRLLLAVRRHGAAGLRIWAIDNGTGISAADAKHIFEDYYQGAPAGGERTGFGLGLSSVERIARLLGGRAGLDSRFRRGAAFYMEFPHAAEAPSSNRTGSAPHILKETVDEELPDL
jgi:signal transduction histidine kinase